MYFLAGAYEFAQDMSAQPPSHKRLRVLARTFGLLHHDVLFVTPYERRLLLHAGIKPQAAWAGSEKLEERVLHSRGGPRIGLLLLPQLAPRTRGIPPVLRSEIHAAVMRLRGSTQLVVAMSPWGYALEQELTRGGGPLPDVLLGSGPGLGIDGEIVAGGKVAWIRSFAGGRSVTRIEIFAWPQRTRTFAWTENGNIRMTIFGLTDTYHEDPRLVGHIRKMGAD